MALWVQVLKNKDGAESGLFSLCSGSWKGCRVETSFQLVGDAVSFMECGGYMWAVVSCWSGH